MTNFVKVHTCGNDFIFIDYACNITHKEIKNIATRRYGIGGDGIIKILPPTATENAKIKFFNADGSQASMCCNGLLATAKLMSFFMSSHAKSVGDLCFDNSINLGPTRVQIDKYNDSVYLEYSNKNSKVQIPKPNIISVESDNSLLIESGNLHNIQFFSNVTDLHSAMKDRHASISAKYPNVNAHVAHVSHQEHGYCITILTHENGVGITHSCGSGEIATALAAIYSKLIPDTEANIDIKAVGGCGKVQISNNIATIWKVPKILFKGQLAYL